MVKKRILALILVLVSLFTTVFGSLSVEANSSKRTKLGNWGRIDQAPSDTTDLNLYRNFIILGSVFGSEYDDVSRNHWAYKYISAAETFKAKNDNRTSLMGGVGNNKFEPDVYIRYAHFITAVNRAVGDNAFSSNYKYINRNKAILELWKAAGSPNVDSLSCLNKFTDAKNLDNDSKKAWAWCIEQGIINGTSETTLSPYNPLTRAQAAKIIVEYYCVVNNIEIKWN